MLGPILVDIEGPSLTSPEKEFLQHPLVGGVILFARNFESPAQLNALTTELKSLRSPELLITVDHEGGVVQRFKEGFTHLPAMQSLGLAYAKNPTEALAKATEYGFIMADELKQHGVDLSFAPVLDLDKGISNVLKGGRAIAADIDTVCHVAKAYIQGMHQAGMAAVGKHFPGHGAVAIDSHFGMPVDERSYEEIASSDMQPFIRLKDDMQGIMPAHIVFSKVDALPASLSPLWLQDILRRQMGFKGMVFSDCLSMAGAADFLPNPVARVAKALSAGCDMALICNNRTSMLQVLDELEYSIPTNLAAKIDLVKSYSKEHKDDLAYCS